MIALASLMGGSKKEPSNIELRKGYIKYKNWNENQLTPEQFATIISLELLVDEDTSKVTVNEEKKTRLLKSFNQAPDLEPWQYRISFFSFVLLLTYGIFSLMAEHLLEVISLTFKDSEVANLLGSVVGDHWYRFLFIFVLCVLQGVLKRNKKKSVFNVSNNAIVRYY